MTTNKTEHGVGETCLDPADILMDGRELVETAFRDDGEDKNEAVAVLHVEVAHGRELLSACGIQNLQHILFAVNIDVFAVRILNGGIVFLDKDVLHKLHSQGRLAHTTWRRER